MNFAAFAISALAVWRLTHLIVAEDGPWNVFVHLRRASAALRLNRLTDCFYCASVWIAIPFALLIAVGWRMIAICIPALSGGAILLERLTTRDDAAAVWMEEEKS